MTPIAAERNVDENLFDIIALFGNESDANTAEPEIEHSFGSSADDESEILSFGGEDDDALGGEPVVFGAVVREAVSAEDAPLDFEMMFGDEAAPAIVRNDLVVMDGAAKDNTSVSTPESMMEMEEIEFDLMDIFCEEADATSDSKVQITQAISADQAAEHVQEFEPIQEVIQAIQIIQASAPTVCDTGVGDKTATPPRAESMQPDARLTTAIAQAMPINRTRSDQDAKNVPSNGSAVVQGPIQEPVQESAQETLQAMPAVQKEGDPAQQVDDLIEQDAQVPAALVLCFPSGMGRFALLDSIEAGQVTMVGVALGAAPLGLDGRAPSAALQLERTARCASGRKAAHQQACHSLAPPGAAACFVRSTSSILVELITSGRERVGVFIRSSQDDGELRFSILPNAFEEVVRGRFDVQGLQSGTYRCGREVKATWHGSQVSLESPTPEEMPEVMALYLRAREALMAILAFVAEASTESGDLKALDGRPVVFAKKD